MVHRDADSQPDGKSTKVASDRNYEGLPLPAIRHKSTTMVTIHKVSLIVFGVLLALLPTIHAYGGAG